MNTVYFGVVTAAVFLWDCGPPVASVQLVEKGGP